MYMYIFFASESCRHLIAIFLLFGVFTRTSLGTFMDVYMYMYMSCTCVCVCTLYVCVVHFVAVLLACLTLCALFPTLRYI